MSIRVRELLATAAACEVSLDQAVTLPPELFNDPEWFEAERVVLHRQWVAVCRSSAVTEPGRFVAVDVMAEPVVVIRGRDGVLRALSNVCRHRSMTIVTGTGSVASLQCPYHLWTYRQDGSLTHAPSMDQATGFDVDAVCLPRFTVDEWHGWVLVAIDAPEARPAESSPRLDALLAEHRVGEMVQVGSLAYPSPWNWKISIENFLESYHHRGVHPTTLEPSFPGARSFAADSGNEPWTAIDHVSVLEGVEPFIAFVAFPTLMFAIVRGLGMTWFRLEPLSVNETMLTIEVFALPELSDNSDVVALLVDSTTDINNEDVPINARTAAGLTSRFAQPGRISHLEEPTWRFRRWLLSQVGTTA
jgi:choline monooxygenase